MLLFDLPALLAPQVTYVALVVILLSRVSMEQLPNSAKVTHLPFSIQTFFVAWLLLQTALSCFMVVWLTWLPLRFITVKLLFSLKLSNIFLPAARKVQDTTTQKKAYTQSKSYLRVSSWLTCYSILKLMLKPPLLLFQFYKSQAPE